MVSSWRDRVRFCCNKENVENGTEHNRTRDWKSKRKLKKKHQQEQEEQEQWDVNEYEQHEYEQSKNTTSIRARYQSRG